MCNDYRLKVHAERIREEFSDIRINIRFPEGMPNMEPRDDIRITDFAPIVRAPRGARRRRSGFRRWSWPAPDKKPVYNFRSEGREFGAATPNGGRCLILADGFYEFTANEDPKAKRKHKWLFTLKDHDFFCIAGIWRGSGGRRGLHHADHRAGAGRGALSQPAGRGVGAGGLGSLA